MIFMDLNYFVVIAIVIVLGLGSQALIKRQYKKWGKVPLASQLSGAQAARVMLDSYGLHNITIQKVDGELSDHFDPRTGVISLSSSVYEGRTVAATAIACHECGHAVQYAQNYAPGKIRSAIVPAVNLASNVWIIVLFIGIFMSSIGMIYLAIILYAAVILFQLVTLPVEFNATKRALAFVNSSGYLMPQEQSGARSVLNAAAFTYVAAALGSLIFLVYMLGFARR